ncbi:MAG: acylphosphatase [Deltaproteobacteria bacterium]|nr:acylphosphatase [Deltaproteobacteria bacterium]
MEHRRLSAIIAGRVQGVFYRANTEAAAKKLGLTGWVRNLPNGRVELVAEGPQQALEKLLEWCRQGPPLARVTEIKESWEEATGEFKDFSVL